MFFYREKLFRYMHVLADSGKALKPCCYMYKMEILFQLRKRQFVFVSLQAPERHGLQVILSSDAREKK
jgi:hypothetical protein